MPVYDLDLEKLDSQDLGSIASQVDEVARLSPFYQERMAYTWMQNIHFLLGDQHIFYNQISRQFELIPTTRNNDFVPRPTTNLFQPLTSSIVSILTKNRPTADVTPNSTSEKDISSAKLAARIQEVKWAEDDMEAKLGDCALWAVTCGTVFRKDYWDTAYGKIVRVPLTQMVPKETMDEMGNIQIMNEEVPMTDPFDGSPMFNEIPLGDNAVSIIDPFRMVVDPNATSEDDMAWIMEVSVQRLHWIKENFAKEAPGYTGLAADVKEETNVNTMVELSQRLKTLSTRGSGSYAGGASGMQTGLKNVAIIKELYVAPSSKFPKGQMIIAANGKILYRGDSPYYDGTTDSWHPYTIFRWELMPGRFWGKSLLEDCIEPQRRINAIDSLIILNRKTMVSPQKLIPDGAGIPEGYWSGAPGLQMRYRPVGAQGMKPEIIPGIGLPTQVYQERETTKNELFQIARVNEVLQGINPKGAYTYSSLQLLMEMAMSTLSPQTHRWERFIEKGETKKIKLIAHRYREPRPEFINKLRVLSKDVTDIEIMNFIGSDLRENCTVKIEAGSSIPRSNAAKQQQLMELAQTGVLGDIINNPVNKQKFLERLGVIGFDSDFEADVKRAGWENEMLENGLIQGTSVLPFENHQIHLQIHMNRMKEPSFMKADPVIQQQYQMHVDLHNQILQEQMLQQAQQQALMQGNLPANMSGDYLKRKSGVPPNGRQPPEGPESPEGSSPETALN